MLFRSLVMSKINVDIFYETPVIINLEPFTGQNS